MAKAYLTGSIEPPGFIDKLLGRAVAINFAVELNDYLAQLPSLSLADTDRITTLAPKAGKFAEQIFDTGYTRFSQDDLNEMTRDAMARIGTALGFSSAHCDQKWLSVLIPRVAEKTAEIGKLDPLPENAQERIIKFARDLGMRESETREVLSPAVSKFVSDHLSSLLSHGEVSDEEHASTMLMVRTLGGSEPKWDQNTECIYQQARKAWNVTHGNIPEVASSLLLHTKEKAYLSAAAEFCQMKKIHDRTSYHGSSVSVRIVKGVYYRVGSIQSFPHSHDELVSQGFGNLTVTNQRIVFDSPKRNASATLKAIIGFEVYTDGLEVRKGSGSPLYFRMEHDAQMTKRLLDRLFSDMANG